VKSKEEAIEWLKRAPFQDGEVELRPIFEVADFDMSNETRALHDDIAKQLKDRDKA